MDGWNHHRGHRSRPLHCRGEGMKTPARFASWNERAVCSKIQNVGVLSEVSTKTNNTKTFEKEDC